MCSENFFDTHFIFRNKIAGLNNNFIILFYQTNQYLGKTKTFSSFRQYFLKSFSQITIRNITERQNKMLVKE